MSLLCGISTAILRERTSVLVQPYEAAKLSLFLSLLDHLYICVIISPLPFFIFIQPFSLSLSDRFYKIAVSKEANWSSNPHNLSFTFLNDT